MGESYLQLGEQAQQKLAKEVRFHYLLHRYIGDSRLLPHKKDFRYLGLLDAREERDHFGNLKTDLWLVLARYCHQHQLRPAEWILLAFEFTGMECPPPLALKSRALLAKCQDCAALNDIYERHQRHFVTQQAILEREIALRRGAKSQASLKMIWTQVLRNDRVEITPLLRYCVGHSERLKIVVQEYRVRAAIQFCSASRIYRSVWGDWIPEQFPKLARRLCRRVLREIIA